MQRDKLDDVHHIAIPVENLQETVDWYVDRFSCRVLWHDESWALLEFGNTRLAFVLPGQHPPHVAFERHDADRFGPLRTHRDGTRSTYVSDPAGNAVEILAVEEGVR